MRVVVIGGGMAGASAALELACNGATPVLVSAAPGATALGWGTLDVAAAAPGSRRLRWRSPLRDEPLCGRDRLEVLVGTYPHHPYAVLWQQQEAHGPAARAPDATAPADEVKQAVARLDDAIAPHGVRVEGQLDENRLLADGNGAVRVVDHALSGPASGDLSEASDVSWVTVEGLPAPPARVVVRRLAAELAALGLPPARMRTPVLRLPAALPVDSLPRLAGALESDSGFACFLEAAARLAGPGSPACTWLFPPVLGLGAVAGRLAALGEVLTGRVAERLGAASEATAGFRLQRALDAALEAAGVERHRRRATGIVARRGRAAEVRLDGGEDPVRLSADAVVLATGRFLAGGLRDDPSGVREPLLDLPLYDAGGRRIDGHPARAWLKERYLDAQPLFSAGVCADARLRALSAPRGSPGRHVVLPNVHVAGDLLGGFDPARERTGLGVALMTGQRAAHAALERARS